MMDESAVGVRVAGASGPGTQSCVYENQGVLAARLVMRDRVSGSYAIFG